MTDLKAMQEALAVITHERDFAQAMLDATGDDLKAAREENGRLRDVLRELVEAERDANSEGLGFYDAQEVGARYTEAWGAARAAITPRVP